MIFEIESEKRITSITGPTVLKGPEQLVFSPFIFKQKVAENQYVVANLFTRFYCCIDSRFAEVVSPNSRVISAWWNSLSANDKTLLLDNRVVISSNTDEFVTYYDTYRLLRTLSDQHPGFIRYNILTTTGCNARCPYCFENNFFEKPIHMSLDTAEKVSKYICETGSKTQPIYLRWFGGEPLVNLQVIDFISNRLGEQGIDFYSTMSTNGLLCSTNVIEKAKSLWRMSKIRISMDGWGDEHNKRKRFLGGKDGFSIILKNIEAIIKSGMTLTIRLNIDRDNEDCIKRLAEYLLSQYINVTNFNCYCRCLFDDISIDASKNAPELMQKVLASRDRIESLLLESGKYDYEKLSPDGFQMYLCAAQDPHKIVITPSGGICKCECFASDEVSWGKVGEDISELSIYNYWNKNTDICRDKCKSCCFLPLCTPFSICPSSIECRSRFEHTLILNLIEKYSRWIKNKEPIPMKDPLSIDISYNKMRQSKV